MTSPLVGFTPHYANSGNLEHQLKMINMEIPLEFDKSEIDSYQDTIRIDAGDILYHPAGIWHSVECIEDSFTINISLKNLNKADIIAHSLKHLLNQDPELRENMTFSSREDFNTQIQSGIEKAFEYLKDLTPEVIAPQNQFIPRYLQYDFRNQEQLDLICKKLTTPVTKKTKLYFNPLSMMVKRTSIPQEEMDEGVDFKIHHNYAGNPDYESSMTVEIIADEDSYEFLENLADLRIREPDYQFNMEEINWRKDKKLVQVIKILVYQGFLVVDDV
uniref:JmjC domain-containing protein n=1 Tax=Euplotes crassus TaxID=5936 RepID=A0A7S3K6H7_EUPCR|mmetsp:Transcript_12207/g.12234  ORF Transcript_12207/g.12234 Transcript_12207/m.12234 type:complete len:274 (+) Transcript_12207:647-1468(+)|eukprot:CAMPEP_0197003272 /NCGR_PEP_ID=MMETSP1380-20130617/7585_1 /TAXON_ID=5936 /ORGANISM="Euplotes crassus, Strain CT5" /LENGTH=273 /DNA_ID=CAMNT_0042421725 /DNA_START=641 /DNA_END=1462 /DNA_ORIENTATION=-